MKCGKKIHWINAAAVLMTLAIVGQPTVATAQSQWTVQSEEAAHPRLVKAIHELKEALRDMERAPDDFGGNKEVAIRDTRVAIHSLKKALYYRLRMDDATVDRLP
jgi:hypothetical protein